MTSRANKTRPGTTAVRLSNSSNRVWGMALAWGLLAFAVGLLGPNAVTWSDPYTPAELAVASAATLALSLALYVWLARPFIDIDAGAAHVRNPLRVNEIPLAMVERVDRTFASHLRLHAGGDRVVLWGLEQPLRERVQGYSENASVLLAEIAACGGVGELSDAGPRSVRAQTEAARAALLVAQDRAVPATTPREPTVAARWKILDRGIVLLLAGWCAYMAWTVPAIVSGR